MTTLIPYLPDRFTQRMTWRTAVVRATSGRERRQSTMPHPRQRIQLEISFGDEGPSSELIISLRSILFAVPNEVFYVPFRHEAVTPVSNITGTSITVVAAVSTDWAVVGNTVYVEQDNDEGGYLASINSVTPSGANLILSVSASPPSTYVAAATRVSPAWSVRIDDDPGLGRYRVNGGGWVVGGKINTVVDHAGAGTIAAFDGYDVLDRVPMQGADQIAEEANQGLMEVDNGAAFYSWSNRTYSNLRRAARFRSDGLTEWLWWKKFLRARRGQHVAFLASTWRDDFTLVTPPVATDTSLFFDTDAPSYGDWFPAESHKRLALMLSDGTFEYVEVTSNVGGGEFALASPLVLSGGTATVTRVSLLELVRLAEDEVTVDHFPAGERDLILQMLVVQQ